MDQKGNVISASTLVTQAPTEHHSEVPAQQTFSRSTLARVEQSKGALEAVQQSLMVDAVKIPGNDPQALMDIIIQAKGIQKSIDDLNVNIANNVAPNFTAADVNTMREMKAKNVPETEIADLFHTNQTKINRLVNGKG